MCCAQPGHAAGTWPPAASPCRAAGVGVPPPSARPRRPRSPASLPAGPAPAAVPAPPGGSGCCPGAWRGRAGPGRAFGCRCQARPRLRPPRLGPSVSAASRGKESKDHEKENVRRIKEIQKKCKEKERAQARSQPKPVKALWKSQKYENVESKVKAKLQESSPPPKPEALKFLRAYSRCGPGIKPCRPLSPRPARMKGGADTEAPEALGAETQIQVDGKSIDFIKHNACNAKRALLRRSQSLQALAELLEQKHREQEEYNAKQKGHVPQYLLERKEQWRRQMEERLQNLPDPDTPPGHTMMPEGQRLETLGNLKQSQEHLLKDLVMLPVRADTLSMQKRRVELERKLSQIEEAIKIFSRPKVFIKLDS
ncbi:enkurin domain-containing protein 1 isoform X3 [Rissa tridactyla]|uniref:enkurin domain-containing protein 1 isoform X3 n=1 Tax=Rissa tridactyla TaxID=75485 RepID=UPI0023BAFE59|nr:enkurin domain-containing protein 1 isoform X3 [Rissa tridactyla]